MLLMRAKDLYVNSKTTVDNMAKEKEKKFNMEDIPGVGPKLADKLIELNITDPMAIAVSSPGELATILEIGKATAGKIINGARQMLKMGFTSADLVWKQRQAMAEFAQKNGTLQGYTGYQPTMRDMWSAVEGIQIGAEIDDMIYIGGDPSKPSSYREK